MAGLGIALSRIHSISIECERELKDVHKNDDLRLLRPDDETQVKAIPKRVPGIQLQPREQIVEVPIVLHFVKVPQH